MTQAPRSLRHDARVIWETGVAAVSSERLVASAIQREGSDLRIATRRWAWTAGARIAVVGAGKAGAGMAAGVETCLGDDLLEQLTGWVNVPEDCVRDLRSIHLHGARPAGVNEPTEAGVAGTDAILQLVGALQPPDLCLILLSGGGSALLPAPRPPVSLSDKQAVTRMLMESGADIRELNAVRKRLSRVKGGGLARACRAGTTAALVISDIIGDPLDMIASGPTAADTGTAADALEVLRRYGAVPPRIPNSVMQCLEGAEEDEDTSIPDSVSNHIVGNNATALEAAARKAQELGYRVESHGSNNAGTANEAGESLAARCLELRHAMSAGQSPVCVLSGGEPVVHLPDSEEPRKGGRNQQLVLAALVQLREAGADQIVILSGGTDGEDGPTDAAGAWVDQPLLEKARAEGTDPRSHLRRCDAYPFFANLGGLLMTGPTHTNVMDLRVALVEPPPV